jgi:transposase
VWVFPGNTADAGTVQRVKDDLRGWRLNRVVFVADRGFAGEENLRYLQRGGGHYIVSECENQACGEQRMIRGRPGDSRTVACHAGRSGERGRAAGGT